VSIKSNCISSSRLMFIHQYFNLPSSYIINSQRNISGHFNALIIDHFRTERIWIILRKHPYLRKNIFGNLHLNRDISRENGYIESLNGKFKDELLIGEIFDTVIDTRVIAEYEKLKESPLLKNITNSLF